MSQVKPECIHCAMSQWIIDTYPDGVPARKLLYALVAVIRDICDTGLDMGEDMCVETLGTLAEQLGAMAIKKMATRGQTTDTLQ